MALELGRHSFDVSTRALVMQVLASDDPLSEIDAAGLTGRGIIEFTDTHHSSVVQRLSTMQPGFRGPISVHTSDASILEGWLLGGADIAHDPTGFSDPLYLRVVEEAGASVIVSCPDGIKDPVGFLTERAAWATAAGIRNNKIVLKTTTADIDRVEVLGYTTMIATGDEPEAQGIHMAAIMAGARIVSALRPQGTRRTIDTVGELLERSGNALVVGQGTGAS